MVWQGLSKRKKTGGRMHSARKKRKYEYGREASETKVAERRARPTRVQGANSKLKLLQAEFASIFDPKTKKASKAKIKTVVENKANPHFVRRNIITKGAIIETEKGKAVVTNRPGQEGCVNAKLVE